MSVTITVRVPRELAERMRRHREVNWSEVVRRSIEEFLEALEEAEAETEPGPAAAEALLEMGLSPEDLEPLPWEEERRAAERIGELEWRRLRRTAEGENAGSTTRAQ